MGARNEEHHRSPPPSRAVRRVCDPAPQSKGTMQPVSAGETIRIARPLRHSEWWGPLEVKREWLHLPGDYVERYSAPSGRIFVADGPLVQFTHTVGTRQLRYGGYIVLKAQPGIGKLYVAREI